jgi:hypothetical protein
MPTIFKSCVDQLKKKEKRKDLSGSKLYSSPTELENYYINVFCPYMKTEEKKEGREYKKYNPKNIMDFLVMYRQREIERINCEYVLEFILLDMSHGMSGANGGSGGMSGDKGCVDMIFEKEYKSFYNKKEMSKKDTQHCFILCEAYKKESKIPISEFLKKYQNRYVDKHTFEGEKMKLPDSLKIQFENYKKILKV